MKQLLLLKYLPLLCLLPAWAAMLWMLRHRTVPAWPLPYGLLALALLQLWLLGGALDAWLAGREAFTTLLNRGLCMLAFWPALCLWQQPGCQHCLLHALRRPLLILTLIIALAYWAQALGWLNTDGHVYHTYYLLPAALLAACLTPPVPPGQRLLALLLVPALLLPGKLTGVVCLLLAVGMVSSRYRVQARQRIMLFTLALVGLAGWRYLIPDKPHSNRLAAWQLRWHDFLHHPLIGDGFHCQAVLRVRDQMIPGHSDWLELLACGGLTGTALLLLASLLPLLVLWLKGLPGQAANTGPHHTADSSSHTHPPFPGCSSSARKPAWSAQASFAMVFCLGFLFSMVGHSLLRSPAIAPVFWVALAWVYVQTNPRQPVPGQC